MYTVLEPHAYNNVLVRTIKYCCTSSNFFTYVHTHIQCRNLQRGRVEVLRVCQEKKIITPNRFCLLRTSPHTHIHTHTHTHTHLFLTENIKKDGMVTKSNEKYTLFYIVFQVLKALLTKICKIQSPELLLLVVLY